MLYHCPVADDSFLHAEAYMTRHLRVGLQAASGETEAGSTGSAAVRAAALGALRLLVEAVGSGDALAFFVPGLVSGLGKALAAAGVRCVGTNPRQLDCHPPHGSTNAFVTSQLHMAMSTAAPGHILYFHTAMSTARSRHILWTGTAHGARVRSGPAAGSAAAAQAVAALAVVCRSTLGDSTVRQRLAPKAQSSGATPKPVSEDVAWYSSR